MQQILVTGASGYLGQHLIASLLKDGIAVKGFGRSSKPLTLMGCEWQQGDICNLNQVEQAVQGCEAVVHLACLPLPSSFAQPVKDFSVNALGTLHVLEAARSAGIRQVVYTSTAQVYGPAEHLPISEESPPRPTSPYAASKLCGEILCITFSRCYGLGTMVLRLFNVYGLSLDGSDRPTVETIFLKRAAQGLPPIIKGQPEEARDFIHVSDVVRAIRLALVREGSGEVINIGSGSLTTLLELAGLAIEAAGTASKPILELTGARPLRLQADMRRARQLLDFEAKVPLAKGLSDMLKHSNRYIS